MDAMVFTYDLKDGSVVPPNIYLGAESMKYNVRGGIYYWRMFSTKYMKNAINTVEGMLKYEGKQLRNIKSTGK